MQAFGGEQNSSLYLPMAVANPLPGISPASEALLALTMIMNFFVLCPFRALESQSMMIELVGP